MNTAKFHPGPKKMKAKILLPLLLVALVAGLSACGESAAPPAAPPPAVEYHEVMFEDVISSFEFVARTRAREDTDIQARIEGNIIERNFDEGQEIEKDALMYRIDPRPYEAALASARAQMTNATSSLDVARRNLKRGEELEPDGYISQSELDELRGARDQAAAALQSAEAAIDNAQINLDYTEIRAPFTGTAGRSEVSIGDLVSPQTGTLVTLVQRDPMLADFDVDEQALANAMKRNKESQARGEPPVRYKPVLTLVNGDVYPHEGEIDYASNRVNPTTGTVTITAVFPNPEGKLFPGQFARVQVQRGAAERRLMIPQQSVLEDMQGRYVFIVGDDDRVARKNVNLGQREGVYWVVESGLEEGDRVIVNGIQKVRSAMTVSASPVTSLPHRTAGDE
jgi:membrane fusion protein (multidrug efflux system)